MDADLSKWVEFARKESGKYFDWFVNALLHPSYVGYQVAVWAERRAKGGEEDKEGETVPAPLITILIISIFIGATMGAIIPNRPPMRDRVTVAVVVLIMWITVGVVVSPIIRGLGGRGSVAATLQVILQLLALAYVISNTLTLLVVSGLPILSPLLPTGAASFHVTPGDVILGIQFLILFLYFPFSLYQVHGIAAFSVLGLFLALLFAASTVMVGGVTISIGGC